MLQWINEHLSTILWMTGIFVVGMMIVTAIVGVVLVRIPADFFSQSKRKADRKSGSVIRNIAGWLLIAAGVVMLLLPGPGMLVILMGVMLADFPGKQRLITWIISRGMILKTANRLRARFNKSPLIIDKAPPKHHPRSPARPASLG